jgi:D-galactarolactone cycloisomerase
MKIVEIFGGSVTGTPEGGWAREIQPDDCVHTLIAVLTDEGGGRFSRTVSSFAAP